MIESGSRQAIAGSKMRSHAWEAVVSAGLLIDQGGDRVSLSIVASLVSLIAGG